MFIVTHRRTKVYEPLLQIIDWSDLYGNVPERSAAAQVEVWSILTLFHTCSSPAFKLLFQSRTSCIELDKPIYNDHAHSVTCSCIGWLKLNIGDCLGYRISIEGRGIHITLEQNLASKLMDWDGLHKRLSLWYNHLIILCKVKTSRKSVTWHFWGQWTYLDGRHTLSHKKSRTRESLTNYSQFQTHHPYLLI